MMLIPGLQESMRAACKILALLVNPRYPSDPEGRDPGGWTAAGWGEPECAVRALQTSWLQTKYYEPLSRHHGPSLGCGESAPKLPITAPSAEDTQMKLSRPGKAANRDPELRFLHRYIHVHAVALAACENPSTVGPPMQNEGSSAS